MNNSGISQGSVYDRDKTLARHCVNCSEIFWVVPSRLKYFGGKFCSSKCNAIACNTGVKTDEHRKKISKTLRESGKWAGSENPKYSGGEQVRQCIRCGVDFTVTSIGEKATHCSKTCAAKDRATFGENHPGWKGGTGKPEHEKKRCHTNYINWRRFVFERDGYSCAVCGGAKPRINAHHILEWSKYPDKRYDVDNGVTLCTKHHQELHPNIVLTDTRKYFLK
jgi:hypothetical protein